MIRNIIFDLGGIIFLLNSREPFRRFRAAGVDPDRYLGIYGQRGYFLEIENGTIDGQEFCRRMSVDAGREISWEEAKYCWMGFIRCAPVNRLHNLLKLREKYHTCLLSNINPFVMEFARSESFSREGRPITDYLDSIFCSYELKAYKPDKEIYLKALAADGMKAEETIFVDDGLKNVLGAEAVGIHGLHVRTNEDWMPRLEKTLKELQP